MVGGDQIPEELSYHDSRRSFWSLENYIVPMRMYKQHWSSPLANLVAVISCQDGAWLFDGICSTT